MKPHYDDNDFQAYLDNTLDARAAGQFKQHLTVCGVCRDELNAYQKLYNAMPQLASPALPPNFAEATAKKIIRGEKSANFFGLYEFLTVLFSFMIIIASIIYYGGSKYFSGLFEQISAGAAVNSVLSATNFLDGGNTMAFAFISLFILLFTAFFDDLILKTRHRLS